MLAVDSGSARHSHQSPKLTPSLLVAALGVVYGDIGTSPLYAIKSCFHAIPVNHDNVFGILSLVFWSLTLMVSIKYVSLVMHANNRGEGGVLALMALAQPSYKSPLFHHRKYIMYLGIFGASLLYGDSALTPAVSVLGAVEGLTIATPAFEQWIVPIALLILLGVFLLQYKGTSKIGALFGPVMVVWFTTLALLGLLSILQQPSVLAALNPWWALRFFSENGWLAFLTMGAVFLSVTGGEALYADMGHFGLKPIRAAWFGLVLPSLLLNYFGQGALLLRNPAAVANPFYYLSPSWALYPMVALATISAVIASQAVISGAFSLTSQAIRLGLLPRMPISHTSAKNIGQVYVSRINWMMLALTFWLVLEFRSSENLTGAYGIAVSSTMVITTLLVYVVLRNQWGWSRTSALLLCGFFFLIDVTFLGANLMKIHRGGWFPILVASVSFYMMTLWKAGRRQIKQQLSQRLPPLEVFLQDIPELTPLRVPGTAVYMSSYRDLTPPALLYNIKHNHVVHDTIVMLTIETEDIPFVSPIKRVEVKDFGRDMYQLVVHYGFKDEIDLKRALGLARAQGLDIKLDSTVFFLGSEKVKFAPREGMAAIRQNLFGFMLGSSQEASQFFGINAEQIIEIGFQVDV